MIFGAKRAPMRVNRFMEGALPAGSLTPKPRVSLCGSLHG